MDRSRSLYTTRRSSTVALPPASAWAVVASAETGPQWYVDAAPFVVRGALDRQLGGRGRPWPAPGRPLLQTGDHAGFWEVLEVDASARRLVLEAHVRAPGTVRLEVSVTPAEAGSVLDLAVSFTPRGVLGTLYLLADLPARAAVTELTMLHLLTVLRRRQA